MQLLTFRKFGLSDRPTGHSLWKSGTAGAKGPQEEVAADMTNHLLPSVILTPGALATLPVLQQAGFHYVT